MVPFPLCRRLGVWVSCPKSSRHALIMGKDTKPVRLAMSLLETAIACKRLERVSKFMRAIAMSISHGVVNTCRQWSRFLTETLSTIKVHKPPALANGTYTRLWCIRSLLIGSGVQRLNASSTSIEEFGSAFPDARQWLSIFPKKQLIK